MCCVMVSFGQDGDATDTGTDLLGDLFSGGTSSILIVIVILTLLSGLFGFNIPFLSNFLGGV